MSGRSILDNGSFLSSLFLPQNLMVPQIPQLPTPVTTSNFPDVDAERHEPSNCAPTGRGRRKRVRPNAPDCSICLEPVTQKPAVLPCKHELHRSCLFSLMTYPILGARSMVHCPMCRYALDRYDLQNALHCDISVRRLAQSARRCGLLRKLTNGTFHSTALGSSQPISRVVATMVAGCQNMTADDGFVYNVAVLAIDRAISHRQNLASSLKVQLQCPRNRSLDPFEFISGNISCHVEVLMRTASAAVDNI
jgi:hypothetical protein